MARTRKDPEEWVEDIIRQVCDVETKEKEDWRVAVEVETILRYAEETGNMLVCHF